MKGLPRSTSRGPKGRLPIVKQTLVINQQITVAGSTGVGFGTAVIGDFPEGNILILGVVSYLQFRKVTAAGVQDAWDGDFAIGSAPTADATLAGTEVDIIASTATGVATGGVSPIVRATNATQAILDNTDNSLELNLQLLIDDANISANGQIMLAQGTLHLAYIVLGDD